jgi:hypothetical protein
LVSHPQACAAFPGRLTARALGSRTWKENHTETGAHLFDPQLKYQEQLLQTSRIHVTDKGHAQLAYCRKTAHEQKLIKVDNKGTCIAKSIYVDLLVPSGTYTLLSQSLFPHPQGHDVSQEYDNVDIKQLQL